ncbi:Phage tail tape measure protein [Thauera humireducens]|uniref:phage tail tape measure protein n=1 Tax=Thauera humireducens TaxID=1134435 RepID=UPI002467AA00|nr:phage tail tape measure protein [Thauera humireducens]CAH1747894.1 Phage tail tape measure protein [Thauera humireducens]
MSDRSLKLEVILAAIDKATGPIRAVMAGSKGLSGAVKEAKDRLKELEQQNKRLENFRQVARDVAVTGNAMAAAQGKVKEMAQQIRATDQPSKAMLRNFEAAKREAAQLKDRHQALTQQQQRLRTELQAAGVPLQGMARHQAELRRKIDEAAGAVNRQTEALKRQGEQMRRLQSAREAYDKTMDTRNKLAGAGAGMAAAGGGALYAGVRMIAPGLEFEESMANVQALTRLDKTSEQFKALTQQARELGAATSFTATQAAEAQGFLAMAGFKTESILQAMPGMLSLSKAGRTELAQTADIASNVLTGFGLQADQMGRLGDVLVGTFTRSNVNLEMLGDTMKYVAPVAAGLGVELETAAALAGKLGDAGIQGSMAGTAMRAILSRLAAPPKMAAEALDQLKISTKDAAGNLRDIPGLLAEINAKTRDMGNAERSGLLKAIAGEEAFSALQVLTDQAGGGQLQEMIATLRAAAGEANKSAATMADNARGDILSLQSAWEDFGITLFDSNNGPLRGVIQSLTELVRGIGAWAKENPELVATMVKVAAVSAAVVAGLGGLLLAASAVLGPFAMARYGLAAFGVFASKAIPFVTMLGKVALPMVGQALLWIGRALMANPIGLAVTGIALAAGLVYQHWEPIKAWFASLWDNVKQTTGQALEFFRGLPAQFAQFGADMMRGLADGIRNAGAAVKDAVTGAAASATGWFKEKLGIRSPSRVFAELGGFTMQGLAQGLSKNGGDAVDAVLKTARQITLASAGALSLSAPSFAGTPTMSDMPAIDTRQPLAAPGFAQAAAPAAPANINITINAAPGMDPQAIARAVAAEIERQQRAQAARGRTRLADLE